MDDRSGAHRQIRAHEQAQFVLPVEQARAPRPSQALFISGNARGGTTLLVRLLDGHPDLLVLPTETQIYPALATGLPARWLLRLAELGGWRRAVGLLAHPAVARFGFGDRAALATRLRLWAREYPAAAALDDGAIDAAAMRVRGPHEYWYAFLDVFSRFSGLTRTGKRYWVEKTPGAERFAAVSDAWCGRTCRFLHVIRDPRDFIASHLIRESRLRGVENRGREIVRLCFTWSQSVTWCLHGIRAITGRYHALRYEDLVRDPRRTMAAVCAHLGIPMDARILTPTRMGEPVGHNSSVQDAAGSPGEIILSPLGRFAESLSAAEVEYIERLLGAQMRACGYMPSRSPASAPEPGRDGPDPFAGLPWRTRLLARVTDRSQVAWHGATVSVLG